MSKVDEQASGHLEPIVVLYPRYKDLWGYSMRPFLIIGAPFFGPPGEREE